MQELKELAYIVNKHKLRGVELLGFPFVEDNRLGALYDQISNSSLNVEEETLKKQFGSDANYRKLKMELTNRLVNTLFFLDVKQNAYTDRQSAYEECYKNWAAVKILFGKNARTAGVALAEKILKHAEKFEFTHLCVEASHILKLHYGAIIGDEKKYEFYKQLYHKYDALYRCENLVEEYYTDLVVKHVKSKSNTKDVNTKAQLFFVEIAPALQRWQSHDLHLYGNLIQLMIYTSVNDYTGSIKVCEEVINFFEQKFYIARTPLQVFYYQQLIGHIHLRLMKENLLKDASDIKFLEEGTYNWYKFQEAYLILSLHTQQYQWAYKIFIKSRTHKRFQFLPPDQREYWKILEQYLHYLFLLKRIQPDSETSFSKFRLGRFLNQTPIFSKDKKGVNIVILIIQILFLIQQNRWSDTMEKIDAIERYSDRYLHDHYTIRSYYFIKMLLTLPKNRTHQEAVRRKSERYLSLLEAQPLEISNQTSNIEIIPFGELWTLVLHSLEKHFVRPESND